MDILDRYLILVIVLLLCRLMIDECEIHRGYALKGERNIDGQVVEEITKEALEKRVGDRKDSVFLEDVTIPEKFRAKLSDYFRSGYDRGHQVPSHPR